MKVWDFETGDPPAGWGVQAKRGQFRFRLRPSGAYALAGSSLLHLLIIYFVFFVHFVVEPAYCSIGLYCSRTGISSSKWET